MPARSIDSPMIRASRGYRQRPTLFWSYFDWWGSDGSNGWQARFWQRKFSETQTLTAGRMPCSCSPLPGKLHPLDASVFVRAQILEALAYGAFDSLHLASAEHLEASVFITTDDRFLRQARRGLENPGSKSRIP